MQIQTEEVMFQQGKRDGFKRTVSPEQARNHPSFRYRDGWIDGMLRRVIRSES